MKLLALLALLVAGPAFAAILPATPDTLAAAVASAQPGDAIALSGSGGDVTLRGIRPAGPVVIASADPLNHAALRSLTLIGSSNLTFDGVDIAFTPDMRTASFSAGLTINSSSDVIFQNATVTGGVAVNGVPEDAQKLDATGNVRGVPTAYAVNVVKSQRVTIQGLEVSVFDRGILVGGSSDVAVLGNQIHNTRRTAIAAAGVQRLTVRGNHISDIRPWHLGQTPLGDHADFMAFWTDPNTPGATQGLVITENLMEQAPGAAQVLGPWLQGQTQGFLNPVFARNVVENCALQGFTAKDATGPVISGNVFLATCADPKQSPSILLTGNTTGALVSGNITAGVSDATVSKANTVSPDNLIIPRVQAAAMDLELGRRMVAN